ncbi:MAG: hypothetical protein REH83_06680 [Rickettsiella sp.]|nr:hypothetical protein [Rickettsiella sp.]
MRVIRQIAWLILFIFSVNPTFAQDTSCCDQLRKEVQVLKEQQDKFFKDLKQDEVVEKKGFTTMESLMDILSNKFPDLKDAFKKIKDVYDQLGKTATN